mmetsp:Transcript_37864/g.121823  ORF Transcript_37864/g.121823 Transcript_37864/m.121823 type:complete len:275 (+) Transcript_37864:563-1387(+)|eukprot:scaffold17249_cov126-Isochrysis_galbana.AAC.6
MAEDAPAGLQSSTGGYSIRVGLAPAPPTGGHGMPQRLSSKPSSAKQRAWRSDHAARAPSHSTAQRGETFSPPTDSSGSSCTSSILRSRKTATGDRCISSIVPACTSATTAIKEQAMLAASIGMSSACSTMAWRARQTPCPAGSPAPSMARWIKPADGSFAEADSLVAPDPASRPFVGISPSTSLASAESISSKGRRTAWHTSPSRQRSTSRLAMTGNACEASKVSANASGIATATAAALDSFASEGRMPTTYEMAESSPSPTSSTSRRSVFAST